MNPVLKKILVISLVIAISLLVGFIVWTLWANTALVTTHYQVESAKLPQAFDGLKIAQISDLHSTEFGADNKKLLKLLRKAQPDLIAITGDLVDCVRNDPAVALAFAGEAVKIAPTYYVPGNHESRIPEIYATLKKELRALGVVVLENESVLLEKGGSAITITGLMDPDFRTSWPKSGAETYQMVLSHRPELMDRYCALGFDLVLSGHVHGGQFRLPFVGGLFAPQQGFFPEYDAGVFTAGNTSMVVSRGLGNSKFPLRFNNRPEVVVVTLESV